MRPLTHAWVYSNSSRVVYVRVGSLIDDPTALAEHIDDCADSRKGTGAAIMDMQLKPAFGVYVADQVCARTHQRVVATADYQQLTIDLPGVETQSAICTSDGHAKNGLL